MFEPSPSPPVIEPPAARRIIGMTTLKAPPTTPKTCHDKGWLFFLAMIAEITATDPKQTGSTE